MSESASTQAIDGVERELTVDEKKTRCLLFFQQTIFHDEYFQQRFIVTLT